MEGGCKEALAQAGGPHAVGFLTERPRAPRRATHVAQDRAAPDELPSRIVHARGKLPSPSMPFDCDVVVIGGGPAGSTAAAWLARASRHVILLERDRFPRFHVGESLLASVSDPLEAIGAAALVRGAGFPEKWGATFCTHDRRIERVADFGLAPEIPRPQTWQVPRARFDELLLRHAADCGADVREAHRVSGVVFDADGATISWLPTDGRDAFPTQDTAAAGRPIPEKTLRTRAVVDASGRAGVLARRFGLRTAEPALANVAVFSHYAGVPRAEGRRAGDIRVIAREDAGWFWMIPISSELTSVGVVLPQRIFKPLSGTAPDALLAKLIAATPAVAHLMTAAERRWPVRVERDFSYSASAYAGDRWIVVGDAGSFLDPVFSTGVAIALESAVEGARALDAALASGRLSRRAFRTFERRQHDRYRSFRRFVLGFYTVAFRDLFFSPDPPPRMFRAVVTVLAGRWRPAWVTRAWLALFFLLVRLQARFHFAPAHLASRAPHRRAGVSAGTMDAGHG